MMMRIYNAKIWTAEHELIDGGEVWIEDGRFKLVSRVSPLIFLPWDREIDAKGNLILPTFKNAHAHSPMVFLRSLADDLPLHDWLFEQVFPRENRLSENDCYWMTKLAIAEYVSGGIGACADMYFHLDAIAQASAECGFRNVIMEGITENNRSDLTRMLDHGFDRIDGLGGVVEYRLGLHAEYTNSDASVCALSEYAAHRKAPVYAHVSETKKEVEECVQRHGATPPRYLAEKGLFDYGGGAYHCVHVDQADIEVLARKGVGVVSCPASNLKLASGIAPLVKMRAAGIDLALGTDGAASNNCLDFFREMFLMTGLQKACENDASAMDALTVLDAATDGGARVMGLKDLDGIKIGNRADFILLDLDQPNMRPLHNIVKNVVYAGNKSNVLMTVIDGKVLYEKGEYYLGESLDRIVTECEKIGARINKEIG